MVIDSKIDTLWLRTQINNNQNILIKYIKLSKLNKKNEWQRFLEYWLNKNDSHKIIYMGSSLKFCLIAKGEADYYPRFGPTCEWDTAAGQAILEYSGGLNGKGFVFNNPNAKTSCGCGTSFGV